MLETINAISAGLSSVAAGIGIYIAYRIHKQQQLLSQRQLLLPLWEYMSSIKEINATQPVTQDVLKAINTLELVALCCEGKMVDSDVIKRTFKDVFLKLYDAVKLCSQLPGLAKTGNDILRENKAASLFYDELMQDHLRYGKIK